MPPSCSHSNDGGNDNAFLLKLGIEGEHCVSESNERLLEHHTFLGEGMNAVSIY